MIEKASRRVEDRHDAERTDRVFKALASEPRREILSLLAHSDGGGCCESENVCGCHIVDHLGLRKSTVSHHMRILVDAGLVSAEKRGLWVYYRLRPDTFTAVLGEMKALLGILPAEE